MMKRILLSLFLLLTIQSFSQTILIISEITVSNLYPNLTDNIYHEDELDGPLLLIECGIINQSNNDIKIYPSKSWILCSFNYRGKTYQKDLSALPFGENDSIIITSRNKAEFFCSTYIFLGTPLWEQKKDDYTTEIIESLPTLQIYYQDPANKLYSTKIQSVIIE